MAYQSGISGSSTVVVAMSEDKGDTFSSYVDLGASMEPPGSFVDPHMSLGLASYLHVVWHRDDEGELEGEGKQWEAYLNSSMDGSQWPAANALPSEIAHSPRIWTGRGSRLHVSGKENALLTDVYYINSYDQGGTWGEPALVPVSEGWIIMDHQLVADMDNDRLHIVWNEWKQQGQSEQRVQVVTVDPDGGL